MLCEVPVGQMPFPLWLIHHCVACILSAALVGNGAGYIFFMVRRFKAPEPVGLIHSQCKNTHSLLPRFCPLSKEAAYIPNLYQLQLEVEIWSIGQFIKYFI